jgi:hypothetical protein
MVVPWPGWDRTARVSPCGGGREAGAPAPPDIIKAIMEGEARDE